MPKTLLLADDSVTIQKVVGITFANEDVELITVDNGDDALARALEIVPDGVLADVTMPGLDGYALCAALKSEPRLREVPVMLLTGTFEPFDDTRASEVGADAHISKPFEAQVLIDSVHAMLRRAAAAPEEAPADAVALEEPAQIELTEPEPPQIDLTDEEPLEFDWAEEAPPAEATPAEPALTPPAPAPDEAPAFAEADLEPDGPDATRIFPLDELLAGSEGAAAAAPPAEPLVAPEPEPMPVAADESGPQDPPTPQPAPAPTPELDEALLARTSFPDPQRAASPAPGDSGREDSAELGEGLFDTGSPVPVAPPTPDDLAAELLDDPAGGGPEPLVATLLEEPEVDPNLDTAPELEPLTLAEDDSRAGAALAEPEPLPEPEEEEDLPWLEPMLDDSARAEAAAATPAETPSGQDDSQADALFEPAAKAAPTPPEPIASPLAPPSPADPAPVANDFPAAEGAESPFEPAPDLLFEAPEPDPPAAQDLAAAAAPPASPPTPDATFPLESPTASDTATPLEEPAVPSAAFPLEEPAVPSAAFALESPTAPSTDPLAEEAPWPEEAPAPEEAAPAAATAPPIDPERLGEALEKLAWEAFGPLSEHLVREAVKKIEEIAWEVIPQLTERLVREEIERLKAETSGD